MEFDGFQFNANTFLKVPGVDMKTEVCAVLKHSPGIVVGGNIPFFENLREQFRQNKGERDKKNKKLQNLENEDINDQEQALVEELQQQQINQSLWCSSVQTKQWVFLGGDLYVNFASFCGKKDQNENYDNISHWNEWRPSVKCLRLRNHFHLDMQTENEGPVEFNGVTNAIRSLSNIHSYEVAQLLEVYAKYLASEEQRIKSKADLLSRNERNELSQLLSGNYEHSLVQAHNILDTIGDSFPMMYFVRRTSLRTLRGQVSAIGLNQQLTQILCENREKHMHALLRNGLPEIFSYETHLRLLLLNLRGEGEKEIYIRTVDNIEVKCQLTLLYFPLGNVQYKDMSFTDTLRVYKVSIDESELSMLAARRFYQPLSDSRLELELDYDIHADQFLMQYYQQFHQRRKYSTKKEPNNYSPQQQQINQECKESFIDPKQEEHYEQQQQLNGTDKNISDNQIPLKHEEKEEDNDQRRIILPNFSLSETLALIQQNKSFIEDQTSKLLAESTPIVTPSSSSSLLLTAPTTPQIYYNTPAHQDIPFPLNQLVNSTTNNIFKYTGMNPQQQQQLLPITQPFSNLLINQSSNIMNSSFSSNQIISEPALVSQNLFSFLTHPAFKLPDLQPQ